MKKNFLLWMGAVLMITIGTSSCNSDDEEGNDNFPISVDFLIQDEHNVEKYIFKEGEDIIFRIDLTNNDTVDAILPSSIEIMGYDVFHVYSKNGEDMGTPYDVVCPGAEGHLRLEAKVTRKYLCPWINNPDSEFNNPEYYYLKPSFMAARIEKKRPLPKGEYYSKFDIKLDNNRVITCQKSFSVTCK